MAAAELALLRRIDELHLNHPYAGSRLLRDMLQREGVAVGRKHVRTLMGRMGIEALVQPGITLGPLVLARGTMRLECVGRAAGLG